MAFLTSLESILSIILIILLGYILKEKNGLMMVLAAMYQD